MAVNKKMHPRNIYKTPPNFKDLALESEEFRQIAKVDIRGKVAIDFKDPAALRALTRSLLKRDWELDVVMPPDKLVPTLPLRLNYILWIEDMLAVIGRRDSDLPISGIDIGTGASCIYPLLAAKKNSWHIVGTEKEDDCITCAQDNVKRNKLESLVSVCKVTGESVIKEALQHSGFVYDFSMCNPPFFATEEDAESNRNNRSLKRPPPHNASTGSHHEVVVVGGEVAFVLQMIEESLQLKERIRIFSTMLGHKTSVPIILKILKEKGIKEVAHIEFCQGRVTRWGVAWSFLSSLSQLKSAASPSCNKRKNRQPMCFEVPPVLTADGDMQFHIILGRVKNLLNILEMQYQQIAKGCRSIGFQVNAYSNTWSNQRRKRREQRRRETPSDVTPSQRELVDSTDVGKDMPYEDEEPPPKKVKSSASPLLVMSLVLREEKTDGDDKPRVVLEMDWLQGAGDRTMVHQVLQYFRNHIHVKNQS